jgi:glycosyltransferase involved in cell wall biosynthesis
MATVIAGRRNGFVNESRRENLDDSRYRTVLFVCGGNSEHFEIAPFIKSQGNSLAAHGVDVRFFRVSGKGLFGYARAAHVLKNELRSRDADLLHAHYAYCGLISLLASGRRGVVVSFMGNDLLGIHDKLGRMTPKGRFNVILSRLVARMADRIIVKSEEMRQHLPRDVRPSAQVIPNGVDFEVFLPMECANARRALDLSSGKHYILFMGDPTDPRKGYWVVEEALKLLSVPSLDVLTPYPVAPDRVPLYLNAADVLVFPSLVEGSPNVIKEAMACNIPIVATDVGDVRQVIGDTEGCFIVDRRPESIAKALKEAMLFGSRTSGRSRIPHLEINHVAKRVIGVYSSMQRSSVES